MRRTSPAIVAILTCILAPLAFGKASAQQASESSPASQLDAFVGDGICTGSLLAIGKNAGHATSGKVHGEKTLDGHWVVIHYEEEKTAANPKPYSVTQYIGYDAATKQFVAVSLDNTEASYSTGTSPGWKGAAITFDEKGRAGGKPVSFRDIFTNDSGVSSHTGMMRDEKGRWVKSDEETCHKV